VERLQVPLHNSVHEFYFTHAGISLLNSLFEEKSLLKSISAARPSGGVSRRRGGAGAGRAQQWGGGAGYGEEREREKWWLGFRCGSKGCGWLHESQTLKVEREKTCGKYIRFAE
jgi:hypothetical protein